MGEGKIMGEHRFCPMCGCQCATAADLAASQFRNRELTRRTEALQARVAEHAGCLDHADIVINDILKKADQLDELGQEVSASAFRLCAYNIREALTAPPSSAPSDDRADTGREET